MTRAPETRLSKLEAEDAGPKVTVLHLFGEETAEDAWRADHGDEPMPGGLVVLITSYADWTREEWRAWKVAPRIEGPPFPRDT